MKWRVQGFSFREKENIQTGRPCCFTPKLPSPAPVTRPAPSHFAQALLRHCSGTAQELIRK